MNIPSWDWKQGDDVICLAELKLGFIAQSCLAPGFSTMMANLFAMRSFITVRTYPTLILTSLLILCRVQTWLHGRMIISRALGVKCTRRPFHQVFLAWHSLRHLSKYAKLYLTSTDYVTRLCFVKLKLLLLAIEVKPIDGGDTKISINPQSSKMPANTVGFFIAQSAEEVKR